MCLKINKYEKNEMIKKKLNILLTSVNRWQVTVLMIEALSQLFSQFIQMAASFKQKAVDLPAVL